MDKSYVMNEVSSHVKDMMGKTMETLKQMQPTKIGSTERSKREINALWKKIESAHPEDRQSIMNDIAILSGHEGPGLDGCDLCKMITQKVMEKVNK